MISRLRRWDSAAAPSSPPAADALHRESRGVVVDADAHPPGVGGHIVDAIGHRPAEFGDEEVVHPDLLGLPCGRHSRPAFLKSPTSSFFLVSTEITGCPPPARRVTLALMCANCASRSGWSPPSRVLRLACRLNFCCLSKSPTTVRLTGPQRRVCGQCARRLLVFKLPRFCGPAAFAKVSRCRRPVLRTPLNFAADGRSGSCRPDPTELAREFEPSAQAIRNWVAQADRRRADGRSSRHDRRPCPRLSATNSPAFGGEQAAAAGARHPLSSGGLVRAGDRRAAVGVFRFMSANQADFPVASWRASGRVAGRLLRLAGSAASAHAQADAALLKRIRTVHACRTRLMARRVCMPSCGQEGRCTAASALPA